MTLVKTKGEKIPQQDQAKAARYVEMFDDCVRGGFQEEKLYQAKKLILNASGFEEGSATYTNLDTLMKEPGSQQRIKLISGEQATNATQQEKPKVQSLEELHLFLETHGKLSDVLEELHVSDFKAKQIKKLMDEFKTLVRQLKNEKKLNLSERQDADRKPVRLWTSSSPEIEDQLNEFRVRAGDIVGQNQELRSAVQNFFTPASVLPS